MSVPIPILILAGGGVVVLIGLGVTTFAVWRWVKGAGKVALIGRQSAGKTTMLTVLGGGKVSPSQSPTTSWKDPLTIQIGNKTFQAFDTAGDRLEQWHKALGLCVNVFYLFDASLIARADAEALSAITADTDHIKDYLSKTKGKLHFTLVGTHSDLFTDVKQDEVTVREHQVVQELQLICHPGRDGLIIGSLSNDKNAKSLTKLVLRHAAKRF